MEAASFKRSQGLGITADWPPVQIADYSSSANFRIADNPDPWSKNGLNDRIALLAASDEESFGIHNLLFP
jgi:hypothetical protein